MFSPGITTRSPHSDFFHLSHHFCEIGRDGGYRCCLLYINDDPCCRNWFNTPVFERALSWIRIFMPFNGNIGFCPTLCCSIRYRWSWPYVSNDCCERSLPGRDLADCQQAQIPVSTGGNRACHHHGSNFCYTICNSEFPCRDNPGNNGYLPAGFVFFFTMPLPVIGAVLIYSICYMVMTGMEVMTSRMMDTRRFSPWVSRLCLELEQATC